MVADVVRLITGLGTLDEEKMKKAGSSWPDEISAVCSAQDLNLSVALPGYCFVRIECGKFGYDPMAIRGGVIIFWWHFLLLLRPKGQLYKLVGDV